MPAENILLLYRSMGGTRISLGADSHTGDSLGYGFDYVRFAAAFIVCYLDLVIQPEP